MGHHIKIYIISLAAGLLFATDALALFANDQANLVLDKLETVQSYKEKAEQYLETSKKVLEFAKSGDFGPGAIKSCVANFNAIDIKRVPQKHKEPTFIAEKVAGDTAELSNAVLENVPLVIDPKGGQMATVKSQARKMAELQGNNTAVAWGNATATRAVYYKELKLEPLAVSMRDTRSIIQGSMAYTQKNASILLNIFNMEANIASIKATAEAGNFSLTTEDMPEKEPSTDSGAGTGAGGVK